jgi:ATP-binding cassette, subfamily B, bacterial PglK
MKVSKTGLINDLIVIYQYISKPFKIQLVLIIFLSVISGLTEILTLGSIIPFLSILLNINSVENNVLAQFIISFTDFLSLSSENLIVNVSFIFLSFVILSTVLRISLIILYTRWTHFLGIEIASIMYSKSLNQPFENYSKENSSNLLSALSTKLENFTGEVFVSIPQLIVGLIISLAITASIFIITPVISIITFFIFGTSYVCIQLIYNKTVFTNSFKIASTQNLIIKLIQESLGSIKNIILDKTQKLNNEFFLNHIKTLRIAQFQNSYIAQYPKFLLEGIAILLITILALYWSINYQKSIEFIPELAVLALGGQKLLPLFQMVYNSINRLSTNREAINEVSNFLDKPVLEEIHSKEEINFKNKLEINNLSFAYDDSQYVFEDINLTFRPGNIIGIYGRSGSGKTTLFDVMIS